MYGIKGCYWVFKHACICSTSNRSALPYPWQGSLPSRTTTPCIPPEAALTVQRTPRNGSWGGSRRETNDELPPTHDAYSTSPRESEDGNLNPIDDASMEGESVQVGTPGRNAGLACNQCPFAVVAVTQFPCNCARPRTRYPSSPRATSCLDPYLCLQAMLVAHGVPAGPIPLMSLDPPPLELTCTLLNCFYMRRC